MSCNQHPRPFTRREALSRLGGGFGLTALSTMVTNSLARAEATSPNGAIPGVLTGKLHFKPRAKRVIFLFMNGGVSHVDTFDPKPALEKYDGKPMPGPQILTQRKTGSLMKSPFKFQKHGQCGLELSELWPHVGAMADNICMIRSMWSEIPNHEPCITLMNTGSNIIGRPSMGSWITYGLGTENANLPGYVVMTPTEPLTIGSPLWSSAFLPAVHQGTMVHNTYVEDEPVKASKLIPNVTNTDIDKVVQARDLKYLRKLNEMHLAKVAAKDMDMEASIKTMETAYRMQTEAPDVFDVSKEPQSVRDLYGPGSTALGALMAVRLVERGVRMVQTYYSKGDPWDAHTDIMSYRRLAMDSDKAYAAVIKDLKQRGLFEDTLVICGTEFGRTPAIQTANEMAGGVVNGRDHNPNGFSLWLAGGGIKGGTTYGATDDFGYKAVEKKVHVHDLHATILYLLGIDHTKLTYRYSGRDMRLTDIAGEVIHDIIA
ncbi:MAG: DUF1501 domain-containing protein [Acidobacteria bacterium]|nr:DUF1501 domain-containing protein [Acidobacteriota bacterium]